MTERRTLWTEAQVAELTRLYNEGWSAGQIAKAFNATRNAVIGKLHRLNLRASAIRTRETQRLRGVQSSIKRHAHPRPETRPKPVSAPRIHVNHDTVQKGAPDVAMPVLSGIGSAVARHWLERGPGECKYPVSGEGVDVFSCCAPIAIGAYCMAHARVCYDLKATKAARRRRDRLSWLYRAA